MQTRDVLVIGLGRFGGSIVEKLIERNIRVTVVDISEARVNKYASKTEYAKVCDTRDEEVLQQLGVNNFDHIVVAIGASIESSIITVVLLKDMGVENITVKAINFQHRTALLKLGVDDENIIMPETEMGEKIALRIAFPIVSDYLSLIGEKHGIVEMYPKMTLLAGKKLKDIQTKEQYNVMIAAIKRGDEIIIPNKETIIEKDDSLIVVGENNALLVFEQIFCS